MPNHQHPSPRLGDGHTSRCSTVFTANCISISSKFPAVSASNDIFALILVVRWWLMVDREGRWSCTLTWLTRVWNFDSVHSTSPVSSRLCWPLLLRVLSYSYYVHRTSSCQSYLLAEANDILLILTELEESRPSPKIQGTGTLQTDHSTRWTLKKIQRHTLFHGCTAFRSRVYRIRFFWRTVRPVALPAELYCLGCYSCLFGIITHDLW